MFWVGSIIILGILLVLESLKYYSKYHSPKAFALGSVLFFCGLLTVQIGMMDFDLSVKYPFVFTSHFLSMSLAVTSVLLITKQFLEVGFTLKKKHYFFLLHPLLHILLYLYYLLSPAEQKYFLIDQYFHQQASLVELFPVSSISAFAAIFAMSSISIYQVLTSLKLEVVSVRYRKKLLITKLILIISVSIYPIFWFTKLFTPVENWSIQKAVEGSFLFFNYLLLRFLQDWPYIYKNGLLFNDINSFKIVRNHQYDLKEKDLEKLIERLDDLMLIKKAYLDEDISLKSLAADLNISAHQLSEYLNSTEKKNFNEYINNFRIDEAKKIMIESPEKNNLEVCYEVGFNSKTSFYKAFQNITGLAPAKWRAIHASVKTK